MSENFIVSARKYRPNTFDSVVGQGSITVTLKNAIHKKQLAHAYLFCGPRGVGKTTCARIFAKTINCMSLTEDHEACNECESCTSFNSNRSLNIHELDAASNNSVEDIRKLIEQVRISPQIGHYSVYIIDEVHMLSTQAFNAFLKTLEEPPEHAIFILATTEKHKILPTILSRCQIFDFNRIQVKDIISHLQYIAKEQGIEVEPNALNVIAQKADGGLRDALSFFDQIASFAEKHITYNKVIQSLNVLDYDFYFELTNDFLENKYVETLIIFDKILNNGFDAHNFIIGLSEHIRDVLVSKDAKTIELLDVGDEIKEKYLEQSKKCSLQFLLKILDIISVADVQYKMSKNKRLHVELMLLKLTQITNQAAKQSAVQASNQTNTATKKQNNLPPKTNIENKTNNAQTTTTAEKSKISSKLPSLSQALNGASSQTTKKEEPQKEIKKVENIGNNIATIEQIKPLWQEYANTIRAKNPRLSSALTAYNFEIKNQIISLKLSNDNQVKQILKHKQDILNFINSNLSSNLNLSAKVSDVPLKSKRPYTQTEKYDFLKDKNIELDKLKQQFKLSL